ncbi:acid phosphatase pho5 [Pichia californica]|nr:acid phosphatase pho5 [[Candida] californica]
MRHGERFPQKSVGKTLNTFFNKLKNASKNMTEIIGPLSFIKDYTFFGDPNWYEQETWTGPYAGIGDIFEFGNILRQRYDHLVNTSKTLPIFTGGQKRVFDSAHEFAQGFTFNQYDQNYTMVVLPENQDSGVNSLANTNSCPNFDNSYEGPLVNMSLSYRKSEADRLNALSPGFNITEDDISDIMTYCGFEMNVRGESKFCDAVTQDTIVGFGYERDLYYFYSNGPGYNMSWVSGSAYANATATLLKDNNTEENLYFSFTHDTDITRLLTFLGLIDLDEELPVDHVEFYKFYSATEVVPIGARFITERMNCYNATTNEDDTFIRILINEQVIPIPDCSSGPGFSCPIDYFLSFIDSNILDFPTLCNMNSSTPQYVSFYWDWKSGKYPTYYTSI